jgi:hypothetical protein
MIIRPSLGFERIPLIELQEYDVFFDKKHVQNALNVKKSPDCKKHTLSCPVRAVVFILNAVLCKSTIYPNTRAWPLRRKSLTVDFDVLFTASAGDREHDANTDRYNYYDQCPNSADSDQNTQFPECGKKAEDQNKIADKINSCPFHDKPPDGLALSECNKGRLSMDLNPNRLFGFQCSLEKHEFAESFLGSNP